MVIAAGSRLDALDALVSLLAEMDAPAADAPPAPPSDFYDRLCAALCRTGSMERAVLFLYDAPRRRVRAVGASGLDVSLLTGIDGRLDAAPLARRALGGDRVVQGSAAIEQDVPEPYARRLGITTLSCTPLSAAGHRFGVIYADRGGADFELGDSERDAMWMLGKTAALAEAARSTTRNHEQARRLGERIELAREIHERVIGRLFGVSLALGLDGDLPVEERRRCGEEIGQALADLRSALQRPLASPPRQTGTTLRRELERLGHRRLGPALELDWPATLAVPPELEPLAQSVLAEALGNVAKHAEPTRVAVRVALEHGAFELEVRNDGVRPPESSRPAGMGLRLAVFEALRHGGLVEFGSDGVDGFRVRLIVPVGAA